MLKFLVPADLAGAPHFVSMRLQEAKVAPMSMTVERFDDETFTVSVEDVPGAAQFEVAEKMASRAFDKFKADVKKAEMEKAERDRLAAEDAAKKATKDGERRADERKAD